MDYEEDFVSEETVEINVEGRRFVYKPTNAGEENEWLSQYTKIGEDGKVEQDFALLNKLKLNNLVAVPYKQELIKKLINIDKEWKDLNDDQKWLLLGKLPGVMFDKILTEITMIDKGDTEIKKN